MPRPWLQSAQLLGVLTLLLLTLGIYFAVPRGSSRSDVSAWEVPGGDPRRGREAILTYGCGACHVIPGIRSATGRVGPKLEDLREQVYLAGLPANTPPNLVLWIQQPQQINPRTAMPNLNVSEEEARHIAAYLYGAR